MSSLLALLERYPVLWSFLGPALAGFLWALVSGIFNSFYDSRSPHSDPEWAAFFTRHPRWGAIVAALKTGGFNLPGFLRSLRVLFGGPLPKPVADVFQSGHPTNAAQMRAAAIGVGRELVEAQNVDAIQHMTKAVESLAAPPGPVPIDTRATVESLPAPRDVARSFPTPPEPPKDAA